MDGFDVEKNFFRLIYISKRLTDNWADHRFENVLEGFKTAFMPVLMSISDLGISNNEIANELHISKMAASKMVKELLRLELVVREKDINDGRSEILLLTKKGVQFLGEVRKLSAGLIAEYENILGKKKYQEMIESMIKIREYHEGKLPTRFG